MNNIAEQCKVVHNSAEQNAAALHSRGELFRMRMESQCHQIKCYRLQEFRESGRRLSFDQAALEWIERFAASFDTGSSD